MPLLVLVIGGSSRFLDQDPLFLRLGSDKGADGSLLDDEVFLFANGVLPQLILDVLEADGFAVQAVFAFAGAEYPVADDQLFHVAQSDDSVGHAQGRSLGVAVEDEIFGPVSADGFQAEAARAGLWDQSLQGLPYKQAKEMTLRQFNHAYIGHTLAGCDGNVTQAAHAMGMERQALQQIMRRYDIPADKYRG